MAIYVFIYMLICLLPFFIPTKNRVFGMLPLTIETDIKAKKKKNKYYAWIIFVVLFLLLALRHQSMGVDLQVYFPLFEEISAASWKKVFTSNFIHFESGYTLFNKIIGIFGANRQWLLTVCAFISLLPVAFVIHKKSSDSRFSYLIYMGLPVFLLSYSGLRQSIAIGLCFFSIIFIEKKRPIEFLLLVYAAVLFHDSAIVFLIAYPVYHFKTNFQMRAVSLVLLPIVFLFREPLFSVLSPILMSGAKPDYNGAIELLWVFIFIYCFCWFCIPDKTDGAINGYMNLFYIACVCQIFGYIYASAVRIGYYFMIFLILLIPRVVDLWATREITVVTRQWNGDGLLKPSQAKTQMEREHFLKALVKLAICAAFVLYGFYTIYSTQWACAYPYKWFWLHG